jgi:GAF domain-containing protein
MGVLEVLADRARVQAAQQLLPVDPSRAHVLDRLVRLAADLMAAPIATLTIVEKERQVFAAHVGLPEALAAGYSSIELSICQYAVAIGRPLVVGDCRQDPLLGAHPAVVSLGAAAYAGIPLITLDGYPVGTLCAVDAVPRNWSHQQVMQLTLLADIARDQLQLQNYERDASLRRAWKGVPELAPW